MRKLALTLAIAVAFGTIAEAADIAFYVGTPNIDGWYSVAAQTKDVETIITKTGSLFKDIQKFDDAHLTQLAAWVDKNTDDGQMDILWLNGCVPSVLYPLGNTQPNGSRIEKWLDGGNMIINVGDWFGYCSYEGGARKTPDNGAAGAANILDVSDTIIAGAGQGEMAVTAAGKQYLPSLNAVASDRPVLLSAVMYPWEVAEVFAQGTGGTYADPVVIHNTLTGGYVAFVNQATVWINDRGLTCAEFIGNWVKNVIGFPAQPFAVSSNPVDGSMIDKTSVQASWSAGDFAALHDVYFGDSFDAVSAATPADTAVYVGRQAVAQLAMGMAGGVVPGGLVPGKTYYWRVDEINESNPASPWKGNVWSFQVQPQTAWEPTPADGAKYVLPGQKLTWKKGINVLFNYVNFGEDLNTVKNAPVASGLPAAVEEFPPGELKPGTTYYWRIDEFLIGAAPAQGEVWSFTTVPEIAVTDATLLGYWPLDEQAGTTAVDWSGHGGHGSLLGGLGWADGLYGGALSFTGASGQYVNCGTAADITGDFTLAAWVKMAPNNADKYMGIGGRLMTATNYWGFGLVRHSSNFLRLWVGDGSTDLAKSAVNSDVINTDSEWHHVAGTHEGQANRLFVDGKKQGGTTSITLAPSSEFFYIGRQYSNQDYRYWEGLIDDVRIYNKAMTEEQINQVMVGNPLVASGPVPGIDAIVDIRDVDSLGWTAGDAAASHDVYFGTDRKAVAEAGKTSPEFKGNQPGTSFSLAGLVAFGGGDYFWRIDEVEAGGQVNTGYIWKFTVPAFLIVDDFEGYSDDADAYDAIFQTWIDGMGYTQPIEVAGNGTSSTVGYGTSRNATFGETAIVHPGGSTQSMPFDYNNVNDPYYAETSRTWSTPQDWTTEGVATLVLYVRGTWDNDATQPLYVALENQGKAPVVVNLDLSVLRSTSWTEQRIPLSQFAGVNPAAVKKMYIGVGDRATRKPGGHGVLYFDDIRVIRPTP